MTIQSWANIASVWLFNPHYDATCSYEVRLVIYVQAVIEWFVYSHSDMSVSVVTYLESAFS